MLTYQRFLLIWRPEEQYYCVMKKNIEIFDLRISTLGFYIDRALMAMIKSLNRELDSEGLELQHSHFTILKIINEKDYLSQKEICDIIGKDRAAVSRSLSFLEDKGYVVRESSNKRKNKVSLTPAGKALIPKLNQIADKITSRALKGFKGNSKEKIIDYLIKIYRNSI